MTFFRRKLSGSRIGALLLVTQAFLARSYAAPAGGGLPWEKPMTLIATSLTGPVAWLPLALAYLRADLQALLPVQARLAPRRRLLSLRSV